MAIFASRRVNVDPEPMIDPFSGQRAAVADEALGWQFHPRPEFDTVVNPILVEFRAAIERRGAKDTDDTIDSYLDWLDFTDESRVYCIERGFTNKHIDHARRVLKKLAAFRG